jgi:phosphoribosyl-ATP pyrophosphohydrolase
MSRAKDERLAALTTRHERARQWFIEATERGDRLLVDDFAGMLELFADFEERLRGREVMAFRVKLIREECRELCEAIEARDLARIAQEAMDLLYVTFGTLVICGLRAKVARRDQRRRAR